MGHFSKIVIFLMILCCNSVITELAISDSFIDNMVLQCEEPIDFWDKSTPGKIVEIEFANKLKKTIEKIPTNKFSWGFDFLRKV